jgi:hypothetical protein
VLKLRDRFIVLEAGKSALASLSGARCFSAGPYFGADVQVDHSSGGSTDWAAHALVRIMPSAHVTPEIALGVRGLSYGGAQRVGFEVGLPHRYVLSRDGLQEVALEFRPTLVFGHQGVDAGLEAALLIPLLEPLHLRLGGRVQSFGNTILGAVNGGLTFSL